MLKDSDGDGVPDYLEKEPNTDALARVNSSVINVNSDSDGTPDHLDMPNSSWPVFNRRLPGKKD